jgi:hypothetical protein
MLPIPLVHGSALAVFTVRIEDSYSRTGIAIMTIPR